MVAGAEGDQMGVVGRRRNRDGAGASDVGVAQLVRQVLDVVRREPEQGKEDSGKGDELVSQV